MAEAQETWPRNPSVRERRYTRELAQFVAEHTYDALPGEAIERSKVVMLDTIGCMLFGRTTVQGKIAADVAAQLSDSHGVTIVGDARGASPVAAALANGTMAHAFDFDDRNTESMCHSSGTILAAGLAIGERQHSSGKRLLLAFVMGHEAASHVAIAVNPEAWIFGWHAQGWHPTFGAATAGGVLLGLDADRMTHAFGIAATQASGMVEVAYSSHGKSLHSGKASSSGVWSAVLAASGFTGGGACLEGSDRARGYCELLSPHPRMHLITAGLGTEYKIVSRVGLKPYSCAGDMHPGIDAVFKIMREHSLKPDDIDAVRVHSFRTVPTHYNIPTPRITIEGLMSYQHCIAVAIVYGRVMPSEFTDAMLADPRLQSFRDKVSFDVDPKLDAMYPKHYAARLDLVTKKGTFTETITASRGDPGNPMSMREVEEKFLDLSTRVISKQRANNTIEMVRRLESVEDVSMLTALVRP